MGDNIYNGMHDGLTKSAIVCAFMTGAYDVSPNCQREINFSADKKKPIIPLRLDDGPFTSTDVITAGTLYISLINIPTRSNKWVEKMEELYGRIKSALAKALPSVELPSQPSTSSCSTKIFGSIDPLVLKIDKPNRGVNAYWIDRDSDWKKIDEIFSSSDMCDLGRWRWVLGVEGRSPTLCKLASKLKDAPSARKPSFIVLDNVEETKDIDEILSNLHGQDIQILVTTRKSPVANAVTGSPRRCLLVPIPDGKKTVQYIMNALSDVRSDDFAVSENDAQELARFCNRIPLHVKVAVRYLRENAKVSAQEYHKLVQDARAKRQTERAQSQQPQQPKIADEDQYEEDNFACFSPSIEQVQQQLPNAWQLLACCAVMDDPDYIELGIVLDFLDHKASGWMPWKRSSQFKETKTKMVTELDNRGLVDRLTEDVVSIHRCIQDEVRWHMREDATVSYMFRKAMPYYSSKAKDRAKAAFKEGVK
ncbi:hypothetical protein HK102_003302 [Quaeritorhiza haematococci]|nr:hypothetical protein HK102_003302 [Quaeritorhiza haematococci]